MKNLKYLFILIIIFFLFIINLNSKKITYNYVLEPRCIYNIEKFNKIKEEKKVLDKFIGTITGYGPDCDGCIGITSSGYDVRNTIYYNDKTYNNVRVLSADKSCQACCDLGYRCIFPGISLPHREECPCRCQGNFLPVYRLC